MNDHGSQPEINADTKTGVVAIEIKTDYGPIAFSFSPSDVEAGIAALAAEILKRSQLGESQTRAVERVGLPDEIVTNAAASYEEHANQVFPQDAIEKFTPGSEAYARGTIEQFSDNLAPALILMLDYLAATTLVRASADSDPRWRQKVAHEQKATLEFLQDHLSEGIQRLYSRQNANNSESTQ